MILFFIIISINKIYFATLLPRTLLNSPLLRRKRGSGRGGEPSPLVGRRGGPGSLDSSEEDLAKETETEPRARLLQVRHGWG